MARTEITPYSRALGAFLRQHRENTSPTQLGIHPIGSRRTSGLRREELAERAGVGLSWYTWLEQGRVQPSLHVLDAVARTLSMGHRTREHLLRLAGYIAPAPSTPAEPGVVDQVRTLVESWQHGPALAIDRWFDIRAENDAFRRMWREPLGSENGNLVRLLADVTGVDTITSGGGHALLRSHLPHFRAETAAHLDVPRVASLYEELRATDETLWDWWTCLTLDGEPVTDFDLMTEDGHVQPMRQVMMRHDRGVTVLLQQPRIL